MFRVPLTVSSIDLGLSAVDAVAGKAIYGEDYQSKVRNQKVSPLFTIFQKDVLSWLGLFAVRAPSQEAGRDLSAISSLYKDNPGQAKELYKLSIVNKTSLEQLNRNTELRDKAIDVYVQGKKTEIKELQDILKGLEAKNIEKYESIYKSAQQFAKRDGREYVERRDIEKAVRKELNPVMKLPQDNKLSLIERIEKAAKKKFLASFDKVVDAVEITCNLEGVIKGVGKTAEKLVDSKGITDLVNNKIKGGLSRSLEQAMRYREVKDKDLEAAANKQADEILKGITQRAEELAVAAAAKSKSPVKPPTPKHYKEAIREVLDSSKTGGIDTFAIKIQELVKNKKPVTLANLRPKQGQDKLLGEIEAKAKDSVAQAKENGFKDWKEFDKVKAKYESLNNMQKQYLEKISAGLAGVGPFLDKIYQQTKVVPLSLKGSLEQAQLHSMLLAGMSVAPIEELMRRAEAESSKVDKENKTVKKAPLKARQKTRPWMWVILPAWKMPGIRGA